MNLRSAGLHLALAFLALGTACKATCEDACEKLIDDCELGIPSYSIEQCTLDCKLVEQKYDDYEYLEAQQEALQTQLDCIEASSCEDLVDTESPACYNDEQNIWIF